MCSSTNENEKTHLVPVGLDAFAKDHVVVVESDPPAVPQVRDGTVKEEVLQEGVSYPQPTEDEETQTALQELIQELTKVAPVTYEELVCPNHICRLENHAPFDSCVRIGRWGWSACPCPPYLWWVKTLLMPRIPCCTCSGTNACWTTMTTNCTINTENSLCWVKTCQEHPCCLRDNNFSKPSSNATIKIEPIKSCHEANWPTTMAPSCTRRLSGRAVGICC